VEARCTTTSPTTDSVTSVTDPAAPRPGGATRVLGPRLVPARVRNHRHRRAAPVRRSGLGRGAPPGTTQPRAGNPPPSPHPAAGTSRGRCRPPDRSPGGAPRATDCAARCGSNGRHSGLRWGRIAGLLATAGPDAASTVVRGGGSSGPVAPRRDRRGRRTLCGPADPPTRRSGVRAGARTSTSVKFTPRAAGLEAGPGGGPHQPKSAGCRPTLEPGPQAVSVRPQVGY
jgi:hypothetical protein